MQLPASIRTAFDLSLEGISRKALAARAEAISTRYRTKGSATDSSQIIRTPEDALAYALVRMPATFAAVRAALLAAVAAHPDFAPTSLLDAGAGPGTAAWAALETWSSLTDLTLIDQNAALLSLARNIAAQIEGPTQPVFAHGTLPGALEKTSAADLVLASYALTELAPQQLATTLNALWQRTAQMLVVVEPGTTEGFRRMHTCRTQLIAAGAQILAPCTHHEACPLATAERWCHFNQRLPRLRDHIAVKSASTPFEDERYSYLIALRTPIERNQRRRILATPVVNKGQITLSLCAPRTCEAHPIPRSNKTLYKQARHFDWGDAVEL